MCAPFISSVFIRNLLTRHGTLPVPTLIITHPKTAMSLGVPKNGLDVRIHLRSIPSLHAKVYMACGWDERDSVVVMGSHNMTTAAVNTNFEIGIRLVGTEPRAQRLILHLENRLVRISQLYTKE